MQEPVGGARDAGRLEAACRAGRGARGRRSCRAAAPRRGARRPPARPCRSRRGSRSTSSPCRRRRVPSSTSLPERRERPLDVLGDHRPRVGPPAVVALADDGQHDALRDRAPRRARRRGGPCRPRATRTGRPASRSLPRSSISIFPVSSPIPLTTAVPAGAGSDGGATTVTPVRLAARRLRLADPDPGHVGDRVAGAGGDPADRAGDLAPALSHRRPRPQRRARLGIVQQAGGRLLARRRSRSAAGRPGRRARSAAGSAGGSGSPWAGRWRRAARRRAARACPPPPAVGTGIASTSAWV